ncbi:uncharacterized protein A1O9_08516 [Exophiala aquamarina CBS 119918]|uniref:Uncharacterized protein n=1 Tax=Exophiala aquamarina CBS 119918 TaxID=1182545 RepID=A0A072PJW6_9EURO|nr:uncharacterized protein A1O9_08516 [Exophiala aquamarina CBS 119918]KEF55765.1 hypothetical protein A1O9_08516 [Exophiala aquamarina CBS 119918]
MSSCGAFYDKLITCGEASNTAAAISCWCPQTVLDVLAGCRQEWWNCWRTTAVDQLFLGTDGLFAAWSTVCADADAFDVLSYSPTTKSITTPLLVDNAFCGDVASNCDQLTASTSSCSRRFTASAGDSDVFSSCMCNEDMLYMASRCDIDGSISCLLRTPASTDLYSYRTCRNFEDSATTGTGASSRTTVASSGGMTVTSTYSPAAPSPTTSGGGGAASSVSNKGAPAVLVWKGFVETVCMLAAVVLMI